MFEQLIAELEALEGTEIHIQATGEYPTKRRTPVGDVAVYQNDGTERIKPSKFVERAARRNRGWASPIFKAIGRVLFKNGDLVIELNDVGMKVSEDIARVCDRIRTGRLKKSFRPKVIE
jgi:hypothetical protein